MGHNTPVKTILILAANPANTTRLRLDAEVRSIEEGLQRASKREQFKLVQKWAVRSRDFYRAILEHQPQIVHFCGHGAGDDGIILEDDNGLPYLVTTEELSKLFKLFAVKGVECVLLNACYSEVQAQAISQYIKYVIGMKQTIDDSKAIAFAVAFYDALGAGETVEFAYSLGCTQLVGLKEDQTPVLKTTSIHVADIQFTAGDIPPNPYQGLSAFGEKDAGFFFGREKLTDELFQTTHKQPMVAVIGASGSGKSSVVFAGLIPRLRDEGIWLIESFRPKSQPFDELAIALVRQLEPNLDGVEKVIKVGKLALSFKKGEVKLHQIASQLLENKPNKRFLLVVDQFEELYTQCQDKEEQQHFIDTLLAAVHQKSLTLVFTLRADFYGYVLSYRPFSDALRQFPHEPLGLMSREELQAAIEMPSQKLNVKLQTHLAQRILDDVGQEPGNLPLLEFALTQLWSKQNDNELTHKAYDEIGGIKQALVKHAESIYNKLSDIQQKQAQRIFLQLVRLGEGTEDTRRVATFEEVGKDNWELIAYLAGSESRLVVTGRNDKSGQETVEVVHEALIREWGRLQQWINENREKLIQQRKIETGATEWQDKGKSKDYLLGGKQLNEAKAFQKEQTVIFTLSPLASEFIQKSIQVRRRALLRTTALAAIPFLISFMGVVPAFRRQSEQNAWNTIQNPKNPGVREALETLTQGCWIQDRLNWMPQPLVTYLFGECANFASTNLYRANLYRANLESANLYRASLSSANLSSANLESADLESADLESADLVLADLVLAKLESANLSSASLESANLSSANLSSANLSSANLKYANLSSANLSSANLSSADLSSADLSSANLALAYLSNADLSSADLSNAYLSSAELSNAYLKDAKFGCAENINKKIECTNLRYAKNLTPEQVKQAKNWQKAEYDREFRKKLGLPPVPEK